MVAAQFGPLSLIESTYALTSGFSTTQTTANVVVGTNNQTNTYSTGTANVVAGTNDQTNTYSTGTANVVAVSATDSSTDPDGSTVTASTPGTASNGINVTITDDNLTDCIGVTTLG